MQSQSQIETQYRWSQYWASARHHEVAERDRRRRRLQYAALPGVVIGVGALVWYVMQSYPAEHWFIGLLAVILVACSLCLPLVADR